MIASNVRTVLSQVAMGLGLSLFCIDVAIAGYQPPRQASAPTSAGTTTGTRRGCSSDTTASLTALAPQAHIGQSSETHPTFMWFMPDEKSFAMEFELYEKTSTGRKNIQRKQLTSKQGWMALTMPQTEMPLSPDKDYFWQVIVYCNPNRPSSALVASANLKIQSLPTVLASAVEQAQTPTAKVELLAKGGFWYDAMATLSSASPSQAQQLRAALLQDLATVETGEAQQKLMKVIKFE